MDRFDRLLAEQRLAIRQTEEKINKLSSFSKDYSLLKKKLTDLSYCFTKNAIVPFSPKALVFAKFIHTNEVLVHLGGCTEHFCEVSTYQALSILDSRIDRVEREVKALREQLKLLNDREFFTDKLAQEASPNQQNSNTSDDLEKEVEIREEYSVEGEERWLKQHRQKVLAERKIMDEKIQSKNAKSITFADEIQTVKYITSSGSDLDEDSVIHFQHSTCLPRPVDPDFDWSHSSPADVLARVYTSLAFHNADPHTSFTENKELNILTPKESPFSDIFEHDNTSKINVQSRGDDKVNLERPISKFRALRHK